MHVDAPAHTDADRPGRQRRLVVALLAVLLAGTMVAVGAPAEAGWADPAAPVVPGSLLVTVEKPDRLASTLRAGARAMQAASGIDVGATRTLVPGVAQVRVDEGQEAAAARRLRALPGVVAVEPDHLAQVHRAPDDPWFPAQWSHQRTGAAAAWDRTTGSSDVLVAVIDTGMRGDHPDLRSNVVGQVDVSTGTAAGPERTGVDNDTCDLGHGTWVGGVVGAVGDNGADVAGVAWDVGLLDIATNSTRAGATCDGIPFSAIIAGIDYAVGVPGRPADVINLSLGAYLDGCPRALQVAITEARNRGAVVVASSGNGQADTATADRTAYPAGCAGVIGVGATGPTDARAGYSQVNDSVDLVAPGGDHTVGGADGTVVTTNDAYEVNALTRVQGTSFAAPYVAGAAALVRSVSPLAGPDTVQDLLEDTARDLGAEGRDDAFGHGLLRVDAALAATGIALPDAPEPVLPTEPTPEPTEEGSTPPPTDPGVVRIARGEPSRPVPTAVAVSRQAFPADGAAHVVLARDDLFADALAGSTLGGGVGPLLFSGPTGPLPDLTRREIQRVLRPGRTVYLLGGSAALSPRVEAQLDRLGYRTRRLAGATREDTAVLVANEARRRLPEVGRRVSSDVVLATSTTWPDAATAGSLGASFGVPIVLTPPDRLDDATRRFLDRRRPRRLYVAGGEVAIDRATAGAAARAAGTPPVRLAGPTRIETALSIAREYDRRHRAAVGRLPRFAIGVNMNRQDAWAYVLTASAFSGQSTGVFVPVDGVDGDTLTARAEDYLRDRMRDDDRVLGAVIGADDLVTDRVVRRFERLLDSS